MERIIKADARFPAITAQNVGRDLVSGRDDAVRIIGDDESLQTIAWIFGRVPDMFDVQHQHMSLVVYPAEKAANPVCIHQHKQSI